MDKKEILEFAQYVEDEINRSKRDLPDVEYFASFMGKKGHSNVAKVFKKCEQKWGGFAGDYRKDYKEDTGEELNRENLVVRVGFAVCLIKGLGLE